MSLSFKNSMTTRSRPALFSRLSSVNISTYTNGGLTDPTATVGRATQSECIDVSLHGRWVDASLFHAFNEERRLVNALAAGQNLLSTHEEVVRVR
jgi:hypothetical protein